MIEINDLCFDYPGKRAINHVSLTISPNTITALVGPNGAGKTTLLRCMAALELPMHGTVKIHGFETDRFPRKVHQVCSYLSDFYGMYNQLSVKQNLLFFAKSHHCKENIDSAVEETAKRLQIWEYKDTPAGKLSRGLRQRLAIAQTIIHKPKILLLDEPAAGLDPEARFHLSKLMLTLQKEGITIIVSSHILSELEDYSTDMIVLQEGKLINHSTLVQQNNTSALITVKIEFAQEATNFNNVLNELNHVKIKSLQGKVAIVELEANQLSQQVLLKTLMNKELPVVSITEQKQRMQDVYMTLSEQHKEQNKKSKDKPNKE